MAYNKFLISYKGKIEKRKLLYLGNEYSFYMEPHSSTTSFGLVMNYVDLTVRDDRVIEVLGYCPSGSWVKANIVHPEFSQGELMVDFKPIQPGISYRIKDSEWPIYFNTESGWVCIGDPNKNTRGVEFIENCVAILNKDGEMEALWLKPEFRNKL